MSKDKKLREEIKALRHHLENARAEIVFLRRKIDAMAQRMFGKKSEQLDAGQMELLLSGLEAETREPPLEEDKDEEPASRKRKARTGQHAIRTPGDLDVVEETLIPEAVQAHPEQWKEIGREENKRLDYQPAKFFWRKTIRPKFIRRHDRCMPPVIAPAPVEISLGGKASAGLMAQVLVNRYCDHLPYYRQQQMFWRQSQVWISRQQMVEWSAQCVVQLERVVNVMRQELRARPYIQVDETPIRFQDRERAGPCPQGWMWTGLDPGRGVVFHWDQSRGCQGLEKLIGSDFQGLLGVDGHSAYRAFSKKRQGVGLIGCWTHVRRKFVEAKDEDPRVAGWVLNQIAWLYRWEKSRNGQRLGAAQREAIRASHSRVVVQRLNRALRLLLPRYRPKSLMRQGIEYALNQWPQLAAFLDHGEVELSNNLVENAIRPSALGKKNWLFIGHKDAGHRNAVIYSLTETSRMLGINPCQYLKDLLQRLPSTPDNQLARLTPANWLKSNQPSIPRAA